jgi:hypothetical protein
MKGAHPTLLFVAYTVNEMEHDEIVVSKKNNELI